MSKERAIQLRLEGHSLSQIAEILGHRSTGGVLSRWLKGVPPPEWTKRHNAKDDVRARAIALRKEGKSYREIRDELRVSKSSLSLWLRDIVLTDDQQAGLDEMRQLSRTKAGRTRQAARLAQRAAIVGEARRQIPELNEPELFVAGVVGYWAEGAKAKAWRSSEGVSLINSDPDLITLFLRWLDLIGISPDRLQFRIAIHETADVEAATRFWADIVGVDARVFQKPTIKRHRPNTKRKNVGETYHGCLVVRVRRSTELSRKIEGWWLGIIGAPDSLSA